MLNITETNNYSYIRLLHAVPDAPAGDTETLVYETDLIIPDKTSIPLQEQIFIKRNFPRDLYFSQL